MLDSKIISRLGDLKYLGKIKGANAALVSKKSKYHDIVKFYIQINVDNKIQKISYQASGCSTFMAVCSYFCELIDGMKVSSALKITKDDLDKVVKVKESNEHVFPIIFETFKQLINKYNKNLEKGKVKPAEIIESNTKQITAKPKTKDIIIDKILEQYLDNGKSNKSKKNNKALGQISMEDKFIINDDTKVNIIEKKNQSKKIDNVEPKEELKEDTNNKISEDIIENFELKLEKKKLNKKKTLKRNENLNNQEEISLPIVNDKTSEVVIEEKNTDNKVISSIEIEPKVEVVEDKTEINVNQENVVKVIEIKEEIEVKKSGEDVVEMKTTKKTNEIHLGHLSSLQQKIKAKENHDKSNTNISHLNSLLQRMSEKKSNSDNEENIIIASEETLVNSETDNKKEKKQSKSSFFSWFRKK